MYFVAPIRPAAASCIKPLASCIYSLVNQWKATLRNDVGFPTVYRRIYCRKFMTLSNQTSRCICKCIRIEDLTFMVMHCWIYQIRCGKDKVWGLASYLLLSCNMFDKFNNVRFYLSYDLKSHFWCESIQILPLCMQSCYGRQFNINK